MHTAAAPGDVRARVDDDEAPAATMGVEARAGGSFPNMQFTAKCGFYSWLLVFQGRGNIGCHTASYSLSSGKKFW